MFKFLPVKIAVLLAIILLSLKTMGQTYLHQIKIGDEVSVKIEKGKYLEVVPPSYCNCALKSKDCNARTFSIKLDALVAGNAIEDTLSIYFDQNNIVYGISRIILFKSKSDATEYFALKLNTVEELRAYLSDIQCPQSRDLPTGITNYKYSFNKGKYKKVITLEKNKIIEETYIAGLNFRNREGFDE